MSELGQVDINTLSLDIYPEPHLEAKWQTTLGEKTGHVLDYSSLTTPHQRGGGELG